jgi:hypothetical protein
MERRKARHLPLKVPTTQMLRPTALHPLAPARVADETSGETRRENKDGCLKIESIEMRFRG